MPIHPNIAAGQRITAALLQSMLPQEAWLYGDSTPVNNSTTLVNVPGLALPVEAGGYYRGGAELYYTSPTGADIKFGFTAPPATISRHGSTGAWTDTTAPNGTTVRIQAFLNFPFAVPFGAVTGSEFVVKTSLYLAVSNPGTLQVQFAQQSNIVGDTKVLGGSHLWLKRIA